MFIIWYKCTYVNLYRVKIIISCIIKLVDSRTLIVIRKSLQVELSDWLREESEDNTYYVLQSSRSVKNNKV